MSQAGKLRFLLMLGTVYCTGAAAADLLKEGTFADTFYGFESVKGTGVGRLCRGVGRNWCSGISSGARLSLQAARSMH